MGRTSGWNWILAIDHSSEDACNASFVFDMLDAAIEALN